MKATVKKPHPRNAPETKAKILAAAQKAFSNRGFAQVGIRDIAEMAGVTSPMALRYFGSKAGLFEAALIDALRVSGVFEAANRSKFGEHLTHLLRDVSSHTQASTIVSLSASDPEAEAIAIRAIMKHAIEPLAAWLGPPDGDLRALKIAIVGLGYAQCKHMFPMLLSPPGIEEKLDKWYAETLQEISDESVRSEAEQPGIETAAGLTR